MSSSFCSSGRLQTQLVSMRMWVQPLALLSGLRIQRYYELWYRSKTQLRSHVAVAVVKASSYSFDSTSSLETSLCSRCSPKNQGKNKISGGMVPPSGIVINCNSLIEKFSDYI